MGKCRVIKPFGILKLKYQSFTGTSVSGLDFKPIGIYGVANFEGVINGYDWDGVGRFLNINNTVRNGGITGIVHGGGRYDSDWTPTVTYGKDSITVNKSLSKGYVIGF